MFDGFVGNKEVLEIVKTGIIAAKMKDDRLPHYLFSGSAGCGKTMLANLIIEESNAYMAYFNASTISGLKDVIIALRQSIKNFNKGKERRIVIVCDEAHALNKKAEDFILTCVSEDIISIKEKDRIENHKIARVVSGKNDFLSWIFISNRCGEVAQALRSRLIQIDFTKYTLEEKIEIAKNHFASKKIKNAPLKICESIANRSYNIRQLKSYVDQIYDYLIANDKKSASFEDIDHYFSLIGVDKHGLNKADREYLNILVESDNKASIQTISSKLGVGIKDVQELYEPKLLDLEFIDISSYGRTLTEKASNALDINPFMIRN